MNIKQGTPAHVFCQESLVQSSCALGFKNRERERDEKERKRAPMNIKQGTLADVFCQDSLWVQPPSSLDLK